MQAQNSLSSQNTHQTRTGSLSPLRAEPALAHLKLGRTLASCEKLSTHEGVKPSQLEEEKTDLHCSPLVSEKLLMFVNLLTHRIGDI